MVSAREFDESFSGVVLGFEPGPSFSPGGQKPSVLEALASRLPGSRLALGYVVLATLALVLPGLAIPAFHRVFVDRVLVQGAPWLEPLLFAMAVAAIVRGALTYLQQAGLMRLELRLAVGGSRSFMRHLLHLPMEFFAQRFAGDLVSRVEVNDRVAALLSGELATNVVNAMMVALFAALMFSYDAVLTLIGIGLALANVLVLAGLGRRRQDASTRLVRERGRLQGVSVAGLQTLETLKASGAESEFFGTWAGHQAKVVGAERDLAVITQYLSAVPPLLTSFSVAAMIGVGSLRILDGVLTMGLLLAFQGLMRSFAEPANRLVTLGGRLTEAAGDLARLDDVLRYPEDPLATAVSAAAPGEMATLEGGVEVRHVTFGYSRLDPPLVTDFSLTLAPRRRVAIVGASGSGKSTLARVVVGLYAAWEGDVLFDGIPRAQVPRRLVANSVALVDQDITLFEGSIRDNLTLWDTSIPDADLVRAAQDACIHDDIAALPGGYDYRVEEQGRNFSGGQRQRLEIARALARNPRILVLDEATSALDPVTELRVDEAIRTRGCTCLIVAHRLSTIRDCDEIVVLDKGAVVERGTHDALMAADGAYARLIRVQ